ncbi:hypothetical protein A3D81_01960 [Candidatus Curtissbacteria bacterium RIFCSPHIGHO2_02_FULL_40_17]|uniref:Uncharacterized protein n=2 Tax=Candidatus Curtissiibacteriota TaxID=1752717 RepID=A0A1F5GJT0_9BACT|nr:MAG: hypothetical protein A3D81_01960 [Candidatus Curtissbacteria bacterium RIFCSPHIGHO2_02_FULL_40_17]OGE05675.1 MAG: hypothetical protein A3F45_00315 [Candidatus Curtissbacteria bacterium RIFCSPHIGHO2_12_FULL_41_17]
MIEQEPITNVNESSRKKPNGFWSNPANVEADIRRVINEHNLIDFPTQPELKKLRESSLRSAISKTGGYAHWQETLGYPVKQRPKRSRQDQEGILNEARKVMEGNDLQDLPSDKTLKRMGYSYLVAAINRNYRGRFRAVRIALGLPPQKIRPMGSLRNPEYIEAELKRIMIDFGLENVPTHQWLNENGFSSISLAICNYDGGRAALVEKLGLNSIEPIENLLNEYEEALEERTLSFREFLHESEARNALD